MQGSRTLAKLFQQAWKKGADAEQVILGNSPCHTCIFALFVCLIFRQIRLFHSMSNSTITQLFHFLV